MNIHVIDLIGTKEACVILDNISQQVFLGYVEKYNIPHKDISYRKIFLRSDIVTFQENRKERLKHRRDK